MQTAPKLTWDMGNPQPRPLASSRSVLPRARSIFSCPELIYRIYSINRPGRLLNNLDLESGRLFEVGAYSRLCAY